MSLTIKIRHSVQLYDAILRLTLNGHFEWLLLISQNCVNNYIYMLAWYKEYCSSILLLNSFCYNHLVRTQFCTGLSIWYGYFCNLHKKFTVVLVLEHSSCISFSKHNYSPWSLAMVIYPYEWHIIRQYTANQLFINQQLFIVEISQLQWVHISLLVKRLVAEIK